MKKRILSLLLACVMVLTLLPALLLSAGAEEGEVVFTSSFWEEAQAGKITYDLEAERVSYTGAWKATILDEKYAPSVLEYINPRVKGEDSEGLWALAVNGHGEITQYGYSQWWWGSLPGSGAMNLETYTMGFSNPQGITNYLYTVKEEGEFDIAVEIDNYAAPVDEHHEYFMCVMVNEQMVWPKYGGSYQYSNISAWSAFEGDVNWYLVTPDTTQEALNEALSSMRARVTKNDRVEICYRWSYKGDSTVHAEATAMPKITGKVAVGPEQKYLAIRENGVVIDVIAADGQIAVLPVYQGDGVFRGWDMDGDGVGDAQAGATVSLAAFDADVVFADAVTIGVSKFFESIPTLDAENNPVFRNNWQVGVYDSSIGAFVPFASPADSYGIITTGPNVWSKQGGGLYTHTGMIAFSACTESDPYMNEINYTAPYSGSLLFDLEKLTCRRQQAPAADYIAYNFAVYKNGEKIWPADADMFRVKSPDVYTEGTCDYEALDIVRAAGFPLDLTVEKGDVISFRTQQANANNWMAHIHPTVVYETLEETPVAVSADIDIGTDLDLNFYVEIIASREGAVAGLEYWTVKPSDAMLMNGGTILEGSYDETRNLYKFTYEGLTAKQMANVIYVRPFSYVDDVDQAVYGDVVPFSIQMYADRAFGRSAKLDKVLAALLTYGANVQSEFAYNVGNMANANLDPMLYPGSLDSVLNDVYAQGEGENPITGASLLLNNQLAFKFVTDEVEGATAYVLEFSEDPTFATSQKVDMQPTKEPGQQKAAVSLDLADLDKTYYVRAVIDNVPGATLTYSLESYVSRVSMTCGEGMYHTLNALVHVSRALEAYLA